MIAASVQYTHSENIGIHIEGPKNMRVIYKELGFKDIKYYFISYRFQAFSFYANRRQSPF
jgi:hypothetical protein